MLSNDNSPWKKTFVEVIDRRQEALPPSWLATHLASGPRNERGRAVHESGRERVAAQAVIALLHQATEKVVVSTFLLADRDIEDALLATALRGVRVYILLASEARLGKEESEGEFDKKVLELHKHMLTRLAGHVLFRSAPHFHAKVVIVDPDTAPAGMLLTANLTTEALERNEELAVVLSEQEVVATTACVKWAMWEFAEHELIDPKDRFKTAKPLGTVPHPAPTPALIATTPQTNSLREEALRLIELASSRIVVSSFGWDVDHEVVQRLAVRAREGIQVTVLARVRPSAMPALLALAQAGATVVGFKWLHAKAIWIDGGQAMVMSANLQADGLDRGFELGARLTGSRAAELIDRLTRWVDGAAWRLAVAPTLGDARGPVLVSQRGQLVLTEVHASVDVDLGTVGAMSAHELMALRPALPDAPKSPPLAHELRCQWHVAAPQLAPNAQEVHRPAEAPLMPEPYTPPVFQEAGNRLVVAVRSQDELAKARALMDEVGAAAIVLVPGAAP